MNNNSFKFMITRKFNSYMKSFRKRTRVTKLINIKNYYFQKILLFILSISLNKVKNLK